jgi:ribosome biogenesis protein Nip4
MARFAARVSESRGESNVIVSFFVRLGVPAIDESGLVRLKNELFDVDPELKRVIAQIPKDPVYAGKLVLREGRIPSPGLSLLQRIGREAPKKVWVSKKGEWLFTCGRNLLPSSIERTEGHPKLKDAVVVLNKHGECLGYGELTEKQVTRWFDLGDLLRRERKHKLLAAKFSSE